jgi:serine/threonine protein kinase
MRVRKKRPVRTGAKQPKHRCRYLSGIRLVVFGHVPALHGEVFISVCQSVQHAHHKGMIRRDVKPSNVLVTVHDGKSTVSPPRVAIFLAPLPRTL